MPITVTSLFEELTRKSAKDLEEAYLNLPEDKRGWSPEDKGRSANDQLAECAMLAGSTADTISSRGLAKIDFEAYFREKAELASTPEKLLPLLHANIARVADVIGATALNDLEVMVEMPWGPMPIKSLIVYPYWNLSYHLGQINYIASLLGCLK